MNRYGLTIPFIIGIQTIQELEQLDEYKIDIDTLIAGIKKYEPPEKVILRYCYDLEAFVLDLDNRHHPLEKHIKKEGHLLIHDDVLDSFSSLIEFTSSIKKEYKEVISKKLFSRNKGKKEWQPYDQKDIANIKKFLA